MNSWFMQLNGLIAQREAGELSEEGFEEKKKLLWQLEQDLAELGKRIDAAAEAHARNDRFQMRLMEIQLEPEGLDLSGRIDWLNGLQEAFEFELSQLDSPQREEGAIESALSLDESPLSEEEQASVTQEVEVLVSELRDRLSKLRGERLDADVWTRADEMDDALYRNGSEHVNKWRQRVLNQAHLLDVLEKE